MGNAGDVAALELSVRAERETSSPVIDLALPAGIDADEALLGALRGAGRVEAREPGMVRIALAPMSAGTETIVPLPLRWSVRGTLRGLAAVAYPAGDPGAMTVLPARELAIGR